MKRKNLSILCSLAILSATTYSSTAMAGSFSGHRCYPGINATFTGTGNILGSAASPSSGTCNKSKNVYEFTDSALNEITLLEGDIQAAAQELVEAIQANATNEIEVLTMGNQDLIKALSTITNSQIKDQMNQDKMMLDMKMDYMTELTERELKAEQSVMSMDDSREEVLFILNELKTVAPNSVEGNYVHSHEVIASMKSTYDDNPQFMMPIRIKSASAETTKGDGCADYDPAAHKAGTLDGTCFYGVKANPGAKLERYFEECSRLKSNSIAAVKKNMAKTVGTASAKKAQTTYMNNAQTAEPEQLAQVKIKTQQETSCNVKEFGYKLCGTKEDGTQLTTEEYLTKVIDLEIIPYGNVSSTNFLAPVSIGSTDGDIGDITDAEMQAMATKILDYKKLDETDPNSQPAVAASSNTPKIINTYRTSSQYFAAIDYVNNIINKEAVTGINVTRSTNASNSQFQSKFMSRAASLSLAENSFRNSIEIRTGSSISEKVQESTAKGDEFDRNSDIVKEDINGAGSLDVIIHLVDKDYNRLQTDAKAVISGGGTKQVETAPNKVNDWQVEALIKSNQLSLMQFEQNERIELLLAAMLANTTNSEKNINHLNNLKLK